MDAARPCRRGRNSATNLCRLKALYIDCGEKDQLNLLYGARRFVRRLNELGIAHRYEEFPDNHGGVDYRMDESLPFLAEALSGRPRAPLLCSPRTTVPGWNPVWNPIPRIYKFSR